MVKAALSYRARRGGSTSTASGRFLFCVLLCCVHFALVVGQQCLSNTEFESFFEKALGVSSLPREGSCCQSDICGLPCPTALSKPKRGFGIAIVVTIVVTFIVGIITIVCIKGEAENFFVGGRLFPMWVVAITLTSQAVDSNALLGNANFSYKYSFYDGAVLPIGLAISLFLNGIFLAHHVNNDNVLTLPDILAKRYGKVVEVFTCCATIASFIMLLAGNLVGFGAITSYLWGVSETGAIFLAAVIIWSYTNAGGLFSVAATDVLHGVSGFSACLYVAFYLIANQHPAASPPSIGFPALPGFNGSGYIYPDKIGQGGVCDMYNGTPCLYHPDQCCYNAAMWCPNSTYCITDNGAYPVGDKPVFSDELTNYLSLSPFPNAIFWNWATIFILGLGNLAALDFQNRCMAAKSPQAARVGCIVSGIATLLLGIPFSYLGSITRKYYGPDSSRAEFGPDTCSQILGLPTCAEWISDHRAFLKLLTHEAPHFLGGWCLLGIINASMSTSTGAILAMGTVTAHNLARQLDAIWPNFVTPRNLLLVTRFSTIPFTVVAMLIAAFYRSSNPNSATGYLLIVAFDIVLATVVVPLIACFYVKNPSPRAALVSMICGATTRLVLEFSIPKDGFTILPFKNPAFLNFGPAASTALPTFVDATVNNTWDPVREPCHADYYKDFTGVDSFSAFLVSLFVFTSIQTWEAYHDYQPLFEFAGGTGYDKNAEAAEKLPVDETVDINASKVGEGSRSDSDENVNSSTQLEADVAVQVEDEKA